MACQLVLLSSLRDLWQEGSVMEKVVVKFNVGSIGVWVEPGFRPAQWPHRSVGSRLPSRWSLFKSQDKDGSNEPEC